MQDPVRRMRRMRRMHPTGNAASCISRENVMVVGQIATLARGGSLSLVSVASAGSRQREPTRPPGHAPARPRSSPSSRPPGCLAVRLPDCVAPCSKCRILCDGWGAWGACTTQVTPYPAFRAPASTNCDTAIPAVDIARQNIVETRGIEPLTPALQRRCSAN